MNLSKTEMLKICEEKDLAYSKLGNNYMHAILEIGELKEQRRALAVDFIYHLSQFDKYLDAVKESIDKHGAFYNFDDTIGKMKEGMNAKINELRTPKLK